MGRDELARLIPHAGDMCLLDAVVSWDGDAIRCTAESNRREGHPLARNGCLPASAGIEYAAQAMAIHGSLTAPTPSGAARPGYLASVRNVQLGVQRLDTLPSPLVIDAVRRCADGTGVIYDFVVSCAGATILSGRAAVVLEGPAR